MAVQQQQQQNTQLKLVGDRNQGGVVEGKVRVRQSYT